jgi:tetratricopeptide (TPR) repeat protein
MMRTYNALGVVEGKVGRLAEARAWYEKSRELALQLKDEGGLGEAAQNIGIVCHLEGQAAREHGDEPGARRSFQEARRSVVESLRVWQSKKDGPKEAGSRCQLAWTYLHLGDITTAQDCADKARQICEALNLPETWRIYDILSEIAKARGDIAAAAEWAKKRDDLRAELERRAGGGGGLPAQMLKALQALTIACAQAGFGDGRLGPDGEEDLARLAGGPAPFPAFAGFLRHVAAGELPPIPDGLPPELRAMVEGLVEAIRGG